MYSSTIHFFCYLSPQNRRPFTLAARTPPHQSAILRLRGHIPNKAIRTRQDLWFIFPDPSLPSILPLFCSIARTSLTALLVWLVTDSVCAQNLDLSSFTTDTYVHQAHLLDICSLRRSRRLLEQRVSLKQEEASTFLRVGRRANSILSSRPMPSEPCLPYLLSSFPNLTCYYFIYCGVMTNGSYRHISNIWDLSLRLSAKITQSSHLRYLIRAVSFCNAHLIFLHTPAVIL